MSCLPRIAFAAWLAGALALGAALLGRHLLALPHPAAADPALAAAIDAERRPDERGWFVVHVLYSECRCSRRVLEHLLARPRPSDRAERVLLVGADADFAAKARASGLAVHVIAPDELGASYHIEGAPLLVVAAPDGRLAYVGGYTESKQGKDIEDEELIALARTGAEPEPLPLFGCPVSETLKQASLVRW